MSSTSSTWRAIAASLSIVFAVGLAGCKSKPVEEKAAPPTEAPAEKVELPPAPADFPHKSSNPIETVLIRMPLTTNPGVFGLSLPVGAGVIAPLAQKQAESKRDGHGTDNHHDAEQHDGRRSASAVRRAALHGHAPVVAAHRPPAGFPVGAAPANALDRADVRVVNRLSAL